jgi:phospholipid/cholesterol/gamma-HCH transport system substrate-binding protein
VSVRKPLSMLIAFAVCSVLITTLVVLTITNPRFQPQATYRAEFGDISGIRVGDIVRVSGVEVGKVTDEVNDGYNAQITFQVDRDVSVTDTTRAVIRYQNVIGQRFLALVRGDTAGSPLADNTLIPMSRTAPALDLTVLFNGFKPLFAALTPDQVNQLAGSLVQVLQGEGGTLQTLLDQTAQFTANLADRDTVIGRVLENLPGVAGTVASHDAQLGQLIDQLAKLTSTLAADRNAVGDSLTQIDALAAALNGLVEGSRPAIDHDIAGLRTLTDSLVANQDKLDTVVRRLPIGLSAFDRALSYGNWANIYLCALTLQTTGQPSAGPLPLPVTIPNGPVGNQGVHSRACS